MIYEINKQNKEKWNEAQKCFPNIIIEDEKVRDQDKNNPFEHCIVYQMQSQIVGILLYLKIYDRMEIAQIEVLPSFRRQGIASGLLEELLAIAKKENMTNITLEVASDNAPARSLYRRFGFVEVAIRQGYYHGTDGILMKWEVTK